MNPFRVLDRLEQVIAREYLRVSQDRSGRSRSTVEQHGDHETDCEENSWTLGRPYEDSSVSASRYGKKRRDGFHELIEDLEYDRFGAQVLILWENSRGSRRVGEWLDLIELCALRSVYIWVHTQGRLYDPTDDRDRRELLTDAVDSEYESAKTSKRVRRAAAANAAAGRPHGRVPYGYRRVYDARTGELVAQELVPEEAANVAELYRRLLAGHSFRVIEADWKARGIRTRSGKLFSAQHMRVMVLSPTYAGLRGHVAGRAGGVTPALVESQLHPAMWDGVVSVADWYAVERLVRAPERKTYRPGRGKHLLSMIGKCGKCGAPLAVSLRNGPEYVCHAKGCVKIAKGDLDEFATASMLGYLAKPEVIRELCVRDQAESKEIERLRGELATVKARKKDLMRAVVAGRLSVEFAAEAEPEIRNEISKLEGQIKELSVPSELRGLADPDADVAERWQAAPMSTRRATARAVLTPERLGEFRLLPAPRRGSTRVPAHERVEFWRADRPGTMAA